MRLLICSLLAVGSLHAYTPVPLEEDAKAPDFSLPGVDGKTYTLKDFSGSEALAVIFTTNHCPDAISSHGRMVALVDHFKGKPVKFVAINSNSPEGLHLPELGWTVYDDSFEDMKLISADAKFNLPYLYDGETQGTAKAYGAVATPHVFIFDGDLKLRYNGRMDNGRRRLGPVEKNEARDAIEAILAGKKPAVVKTRPVGCTTKWKEKSGMVAEENRKWKDQEITVEVAGADAMGKLVANKGRKGMRLINLWSTTCGPCLAEFPDLAEICRQYSWHDFEFISLSFDEESDKEKVTKFLKQQEVGLSPRNRPLLKEDGRTTSHFIFKGDTEDLGKVFKDKWNGALPFTLLVGPEGEVLYEHSGKIDPLTLKKKIVAQIWKRSEE
ncbi:redoxin domain-containing protein [Akkermansiaceae bacterium]|nr:redoxin domain-containing protein [Akkermansiaceae bacterium]MDB4537431.1 redoxin domain-containing protein [Akkermansiaceae bacterium]MDB4544540.1 redoxin domain-containing protein [Akkermansiaceae bacterium]